MLVFVQALISVEILYALCNGLVSATMFKYLSDILPPAIRYTGQSMIWGIAASIFGGTAPLVAQKLSTININYVIGYVSLNASLAFLSTLYKNTK